ncbi:MAG: dienelactone hydrolase family protein [Pseudomonadota bacterium]
MRIFLLFFVVILGACSSRSLDGAETIAFQSASPQWFDSVTGAPDVTGRGELVFPAQGHAPFPAVVILHSSQGRTIADKEFAQALIAEGFAVFALDSFRPRGLSKITDEQTKVSEASILFDLFEAQKVLIRHPKIDSKRIAVAGFSKGGIPALYAAYPVLTDAYDHEHPFAAYIAYYPWCGLSPSGFETNGRPILVHVGSSDRITPPELCGDLVAQTRQSDPNAQIHLHVYEGAGHGFNHPYLQNIPGLPVTYAIPKNCRIVQQADGSFTETFSDRALTGENYAEVITACSKHGGFVSGDKDATREALARTLNFLKAHLTQDGKQANSNGLNNAAVAQW